MRVRVTHIDDRPAYIPLPKEGVLEYTGKLWPEYLFDNNRVYLSIEHGDYKVILDGTCEEFEAALKRAKLKRAKEK
jgi:hypothetical protein